MTDGMTDRSEIVRAWHRGYTAGVIGLPWNHNPYMGSNEVRDAWERGRASGEGKPVSSLLGKPLIPCPFGELGAVA